MPGPDISSLEKAPTFAPEEVETAPATPESPESGIEGETAPEGDNESAPTDKEMDAEYDRVDGAGKHVQALEKSNQRTEGQLRDVRRALSLPDAPFTTETARSLESAGKRLDQMKTDLANMENQYLDAPEEGEGRPDQAAEAEARLAELREAAEQTEEELAEARQASMLDWSKDASRHFADHFASDFKKSRNGERAAKILEARTARTILEGTKDFVQTGKYDFDLARAEIKWKFAKDADGKEIQYITNVDVSLGSKEAEPPAGEKEALVTGDEQKQLDGKAPAGPDKPNWWKLPDQPEKPGQAGQPKAPEQAKK